MGLTYAERLWPDTSEFNDLLAKWHKDGSAVLLGYVWKGYDSLCKQMISVDPVTQSDDDIERSITQLLEPEISAVMSGFEPFYIQHNSYEYETRKPSPAQPPEYDLAFVWHALPRIKWPLEAKVLKTDATTAEYISEIKSNFLTCRYAPFSAEAAMLGYLLKGKPGKVFDKIAVGLSCKLKDNPDFLDRDHKTSDHRRVVPKGKDYPYSFRCHHMILKIGDKAGNQ